ncbi:MAG TPA: hypothetical protein V6D26_03610 [Stenomitos sp.]
MVLPMKPPPDDWLTANAHSSNESCSQITFFSTDKKMNSEFERDYGISPVTTAPPVSSQAASTQSFQPPYSFENKHPEASCQTTTASKFLARPHLSFVQQLVLKLVVYGVIATLPSLLGLASNKTNWEWEFHLKMSSKPNQVEETTKPERVEMPTKLAPVEKVTEPK